MAKSQENGITILLGLKDYGVGEVIVQTEVKGRRKCPHCGSSKLYRHGVCRLREVLHTWLNGNGETAMTMQRELLLNQVVNFKLPQMVKINLRLT